MAARKKATTSSQPEAGRALKPVRKKPPRGTDLALTLTTSNGTSLILNYWDLWFSLVTVNDYGGDLNSITDTFSRRLYWALQDRLTWNGYLSRERKRNHLLDLKRRLEGASATPAQVVLAAGDLAETEKWRARRKLDWICGSPDKEREWSLPMRESPRKRRFEHALRGFWPQFPVSPDTYAEEICSKFKTMRVLAEDKSLAAAQTLDRYVDQSGTLVKSGKYAESLALLRALMTVVIELSQTRWATGFRLGIREVVAAYMKIPLDRTGFDETVFFADILNFLTWNDRWLVGNRIEDYFKGLKKSQADLCVKHLRNEVAALLEDLLEDRLEEALDLLGKLIAEQERFDQFEAVARLMEGDYSYRIIRLVDSAMKRRKRSLACKVIEAALTGGGWASHELKEQYEKIKRGDWSPAPRE